MNFTFNSPSNLGQNAFYEQKFFDDGIVNATKVKACFPKSGAVAYIDYCLAPPMSMHTSNVFAKIVDTNMQSGDLLVLNDHHGDESMSSPEEELSSPTPGSHEAADTQSLDKSIVSICPTGEANFAPGQCLNKKSDTIPVMPSKSFPPGNLPNPLSSESDELASSSKSAAMRPTNALLTDCDFSKLNAGDFVTSACTMDITAYSLGPQGYTPGGAARVFDSSNPTKGSDQLGAPNKHCLTSGPGEGTGGSPLYQPNPDNQNCNDLGNLLIVQKHNEAHPVPTETGGCIIFSFPVPVVLNGVGVLDIPPGTTVMYTVSV
jgi:hypothetical protein